MRPPPPPDRDSVFAWSWLGRMAPDDPREPWNVGAGANTDANANTDGFRCASRPSMAADSGCESEIGCDDDDDNGDSFYCTPEFKDPNECSAFSVTTTSTSEYIDVTASRYGPLMSSHTLILPRPLLPSPRGPAHENAGARVVVRAPPRSPRRRRHPHRRFYTHGGCSGRAPRTLRLPAPALVRTRYSGVRRGPPACSRSWVGSVREMTGSRGSTLRWCVLSRSVRCGIVSGEGMKLGENEA